MAKWKVVTVLFALVIVLTNARNVPKEAALKTVNDNNNSSSNQKNGNVPTHAGLNDQKNFIYGGGVGGVTGVLPFGGTGGVGAGAGVGGGIGALGDVGGLGGARGIGGLGALGGVGGLGGGSALGGGGGVLPLP